MYKDKLKLAWYDQKKACERRTDALGNPIEFKLTFEEWKDIWIKSGKLEQRGKRKGQYVMARYNDIGSYAVGNVYITLHSDNIRFAQLGRKHDRETCEKKSKSLKGKNLGRTAWNKGIPRDEATKQKISDTLRSTGSYVR